MAGDNARLAGHLRRLTGPPASDWHLLGQFATEPGGPAFAELVRRHGPMVLGVCRHQLRAAAERSTPTPPDADRWELLAILDEELHALPDRYRAPLVACHLLGRTQDEVAREMGWSLSTLRRRLERGRRLLGARL